MKAIQGWRSPMLSLWEESDSNDSLEQIFWLLTWRFVWWAESDLLITLLLNIALRERFQYPLQQFNFLLKSQADVRRFTHKCVVFWQFFAIVERKVGLCLQVAFADGEKQKRFSLYRKFKLLNVYLFHVRWTRFGGFWVLPLFHSQFANTSTHLRPENFPQGRICILCLAIFLLIFIKPNAVVPHEPTELSGAVWVDPSNLGDDRKERTQPKLYRQFACFTVLVTLGQRDFRQSWSISLVWTCPNKVEHVDACWSHVDEIVREFLKMVPSLSSVRRNYSSYHAGMV